MIILLNWFCSLAELFQCCFSYIYRCFPNILFTLVNMNVVYMRIIYIKKFIGKQIVWHKSMCITWNPWLKIIPMCRPHNKIPQRRPARFTHVKNYKWFIFVAHILRKQLKKNLVPIPSKNIIFDSRVWQWLGYHHKYHQEKLGGSFKQGV